jgi:carbamoyl-phosphate synthase small subunit
MLSLSDGATFEGLSPAWQKDTFKGEVVFNTGMTGYTESLTDPSYAGQILVFTFPLIGNYGVASPDSWESTKIHAAGVVTSEACKDWSHSQSHQSLMAWLRQQNVPLMTDVDTRALTKHLRSRGTMVGAIASQKVGRLKPLKPVKVSIDEPIVYNQKYGKRVILVDCGAKENILRSLLELPVSVKRVPHDYDYSAENYDGVLLSNGPGDPTEYQATIANAAKALKKGKPVFGICLGTQIMALAAGAKTYKLKFGHRGHNQPCINSQDESCSITSQNHGYAIDEKSLPRNWKVYYRNLNDGSVEGIEHATKPFFSVQFHPEATPGPTDTAWLFKRFYDSL